MARSHILIVEDDDAIRRLLKRIVESSGYSTEEAENGKQACEIFIEEPDRFSLVVLDHVMPVMKGVTAGLEIRKSRPDIPILFLTGVREEIKEIENVLDQRSDLIRKPFHARDILEKIENLLKSSEDN